MSAHYAASSSQVNEPREEFFAREADTDWIYPRRSTCEIVPVDHYEWEKYSTTHDEFAKFPHPFPSEYYLSAQGNWQKQPDAHQDLLPEFQVKRRSPKSSDSDSGYTTEQKVTVVGATFIIPFLAIIVYRIVSAVMSGFVEVLEAIAILSRPPVKCDFFGCRNPSVLEWALSSDTRARTALATTLSAIALMLVIFFACICAVWICQCISAALSPPRAANSNRHSHVPAAPKSIDGSASIYPPATICQRIGAALLETFINFAIGVTFSSLPLVGFIIWILQWYFKARGESFAYRIIGLQCFDNDRNIPLGLCSMFLWDILSCVFSFIDFVMLCGCCCQRTASERILGAKVVQKTVLA